LEGQESESFRAVRVPVLLNIGLTALKIQPPAPSVTIQSASRVLATPNLSTAEKTKALYRRGQAHVLTKEEDEAEKDLSQADNLLGGSDAALKAELERVRQKRKEKREKEKKAYRGLFS
jgi:peptidyl-prolyl isomerase D